jgi:hypothetical protein
MFAQVRYLLLKKLVKHLLIYEGANHVRIIVERQYGFYHHCKNPKSILLVLFLVSH